MQQAIFITGGPGSGKGTQAHALARKLDFKVFSGGEISRALAKNNPEIQVLIDKGELIDDETILREIDRLLEINSQAKGFIFDGVPRNMYQLPKIIEMLVRREITKIKCFYLNISEDLAVKRIMDRKICPQCQTPYRPGEMSYETNTCANCKIALQLRSDDNEASVRHRWQIYQKETAPILDYFRTNSRLVEIDASPNPEVISAMILNQNENQN